MTAKDTDINDNAEIKDQKSESNIEESATTNQESETIISETGAMESKIKDLEEVAKKAQRDYVMLKYDFDSYQRRMESDAKDQKSQNTIDLMKKILPVVDQLSYSVEHMPEDMKGDNWADGVKLVYDNAVKILAGL